MTSREQLAVAFLATALVVSVEAVSHAAAARLPLSAGRAKQAWVRGAAPRTHSRAHIPIAT